MNQLQRAYQILDRSLWKQGLTGCWTSTLVPSADYPRLYVGGGREHRQFKGVHVMAYERACGPVPAGVDVMHSCDNPRCCNPRHLSVGTRQDNMDDCARKGRTGSRRCTLSGDQVREIKILLSEGGLSKRSIAKRYNVADTLIGRIARGELWKGI